MTRRARKRLILVLAAGGILATGVLGAHTLRQVRKERTIAAKLEEGMAAYAARDYETAINALAFYYNRKGDNAEAAYALADSRRRIPAEDDRHIHAAIIVARQALELDPSSRPTMELLLELYGQAGFVTERLEVADKLLASDPRHAGAMLARVECQIVLGRLDRALEAAEAMAAALPDNMDAHRHVVGLMDLLGRPREAIIAYATNVAAEHPASVRAAALHAGIKLRFADIPAAVALARSAAELQAESVAAVSDLLLVLDSVGLDEDASRFLEREVASGRLGTEVSLLAAERAWKIGRPAEARRYIDAAAAAGDEEAVGWAALLGGEGFGTTAASPSSGALASGNSLALAYWREVVAGHRALLAGDPAAARQHLRTALAARPESTLVEFLLGRVHESVGDWPTAVSRWEMVVARDPGYRVARLSLVATLLRHGRIDDARRHAVRALSARSGLVEVYGVSRAFIAAIETGRAPPGDLERVVGVLEDLRGRPATDPVVLPLLARAYLGGGRTADAHAVVRAIIDGGVVPSAEDTITLANALRRSSPDLAGALLAAVRTAAPGDTDLIFVDAMAAAAAGRPEEGRRALEAALEASQGPARSAARIHLGIYLDRIGDPDAGAVLAQVAADEPSSARAQIALLESQSAWADEAAVAAAIGRLTALAGEASPIWKIHEARRLLTFERNHQQAARVVQLLADVLRMDPDNPAGMTLMADAMLLLDDRAKAIDFLDRVVGNNPVPALYPTLVALLSESGRADEAQRRLREFLRLGPLPVELRRTRAELLAAHGLLAEAQREFESLAAEGVPTDLLNLARLKVRRGDLPGARAILDTLAAAPEPGAQILLTAAEVAALQGEVDRGVALLQRLPDTLSPRERAVHRAGFLARHGRVADAERVYLDAAAAGEPEAVAALASFYIARGRADAASAALAPALAAHPAHPELQRLRNLAQLSRGESLTGGGLADAAAAAVTEGDERTRQRFVEAMRAWEANPSDRAALVGRLRRITESSPTFYPAWFFLVATLMEGGNIDEAVQASRVAARVIQADPRAARLAVAALTRAGEHGEALEMARQWRARLVGGTFEADVAIAELCGLLNRPADALAALDPWRVRIAEEAAASPERLELYAALLARAGRHDEAHALLWPLVEADARFAGLYVRVSEQTTAGPAVRAQWIARVEPAALEQPGGRFDLAHAWFLVASESGDSAALARAVELLGDAPEAHPNPARAALLMAAAQEILGNPESALRFYRIAIGHDPDDPAVRNNFAYLLVTTGGPAAEALPHATRAAELAAKGNLPPQVRASILDTLGVVLLHLGRFDDAERTFRDAMALNPRDVGILIGAAEAQARRGDSPGATATVRRIDSMIASGSSVAPGLGGRLEAVRALIASGSPDKPG